MNQTKAALYALIRIALTGDLPKAFPESIGWNELLEYTRMQGVASIAMDGLNVLIKDGCFKPIGLDVKTKLQWYALAMLIEK